MPATETSPSPLLTPQQSQFLLFGYCIVPAFTNILINAVLGWLAFRGVEQIPVFGWNSTAICDTLGTCYLLPAITCLIVTPVVRYQVKSGAVAPLATTAEIGLAQTLSHRSVLLRSVVFGGTCFALLAPLATGAYCYLGFEVVPKQGFLWFKSLSSGAFGAAITPLIAFVAMIDSSKDGSQAAA